MQDPAPENLRKPQIILAFDFGLRRIGVAAGDTITRTASPVTTIVVTSSQVAFENIDVLMKEWRPDLVVVGLPYNVDDSEGDMSAAARTFAAQLKDRYALTVELIDERYSSLDAERRLQAARESGARRRRVAKSDIDAAAACVILERWLTERT